MSTSGGGLRGFDWFAVQVRAGREQSSAAHLRVRGYETFLPVYAGYHRWSDRRKRVERALFAGYVFCRFGPAVVSKVVSAPGVIRIVADERGLPSAIPAMEIEAIQRIVETRLTVAPWPFVQVGDRVRVQEGPLRDIEGIVLARKHRHRLVVSIPILQRSVAVEIDAYWVSVPLGVLLDRPLPGDAPGHRAEPASGW